MSRLTVHTARITYTGPDRLDVTRAGNDPLGVAFAPTWAIVAPVIDARKKIASLIAAGRKLKSSGNTIDRDDLRAEVLKAAEDAAWATYVPQYTAEMRVSAGVTEAHPRFGREERAAVIRGVRPRPEAWREVEARARVVLVCFCTDPMRCHRRLLAGFFVARGAGDGGELTHATRCGCGRELVVEPRGVVCPAGCN